MRQNGASAVGIRCLSKGNFFEICCLRTKPLPCQAVGCLLGAILCTLRGAVLRDKAYAMLGALRGAVLRDKDYALLGILPCTLLGAVPCDKDYALLGILPALRTR